MKITLEGHVTPADKQRSDYLLVPIDLAQAASRLHVRYRYSARISASQHEGGNVIDIGLFDPRGTAFPGTAGFRGWSGSDRAEFTLTPEAATPGYLPGPLPAGRYHVILGLYHIWQHGADYQIEVEADPSDPSTSSGQAPSGGAVRAEPVRAAVAGPQPSVSGARPLQWLRGDLQCHSEHSDATGTLAQIAAGARALDFDFLAVTDHNTVSHHPHLAALADDDLVLIPGQEVTTYYGHMNVWGTTRWCDFRCRSAAEMAAVIDLAHASGGVCSINHPKTDGPPWEYGFDLPVDAMEVWQAPWPWRNAESLATWHTLLRAGRRLPAVGGSDYHFPAGEPTGFQRLGRPTTWVKAADRGAGAVLEAIRAGRASISAVPDGPRLDLSAAAAGARAGMGEELVLPSGAPFRVTVAVGGVERGAGWTLQLIADGSVAHAAPVTADTATVEVELSAGTYVCAELVGDAPRALLPPNLPPDLDLRGWRWALTNPVYIRSM